MTFHFNSPALIKTLAFTLSLGAAAFAEKAESSPVAAVAAVNTDTAAPASTPATAATSGSKSPAGIKMEKAPAGSGKACEDVKANIDAKLKAKGVKAYTLTVMPKAEVKTEKVVGRCEAGAKTIVYKRG